MCLYPNRILTPPIRGPVECWKLMLVDLETNRLLSPYMQQCVPLNGNLTIIPSSRYSGKLADKYSIGAGFIHAFTSPLRAIKIRDKHFFSDCLVLKCMAFGVKAFGSSNPLNPEEDELVCTKLEIDKDYLFDLLKNNYGYNKQSNSLPS